MIKTTAILGMLAASTAIVAFPLPAAAQPPTSVQLPTNDVQVYSGAASPCPFDITITGTGEVTLTTFYDNTGTPTRQSIHGALVHTISSAWHTLVSNGPAPVHLDLGTGQMVDTGKEFAFHVPGDGIIVGQAGRLVLAADGSELSFAGHSVTNTSALCTALSP